MSGVKIVILLPFLLLALTHGVSTAAETFKLSGKVIDGSGRAVSDAEVFIYDSAAIRRPADFISPKSGQDGSFLINLPKGKYWAVARVRKGEKYGPLLPGDRHSGEPAEIDPANDPEFKIDFTVADLREIAQNRQKTRDDHFRLSGRILDSDGKPVKNAYAFAWGESEAGEIPPFISAWTDEGGGYVLVLPPGKYFVRAALQFPPEPQRAGEKKLSVDVRKKEVAADIQVPGDAVPAEGTLHDEADDD